MFKYELLRNQWAVLALCGGIALVFYFIVLFYDYHRDRKTKADNPTEYETEYLGVWQAIPWTVKITVALIFIFAVIYSVNALTHPKSW